MIHIILARITLRVPKFSNFGKITCYTELTKIRRDTIFNGNVQEMVFPNDYPDEKLCGKPKGMKVILQERELWRSNLKTYCKNNNVSLEENLTCCAKHILAYQVDFKIKNPCFRK